MNAQEIWTIGHSNKTSEVFLGMLKAHRIEALADVRRFPGSRRYPHFNSENLSSLLNSAEIEYQHFPELGGRRTAQPNSPNDAWRHPAFRGYADYMSTPAFKQGAERLVKLASARHTAVMCAEVLWWQCHRSLVADYFKAHGWKVWHILSENKVEEHPYTAPARIVDGRLTYSAASSPMEFQFES